MEAYKSKFIALIAAIILCVFALCLAGCENTTPAEEPAQPEADAVDVMADRVFVDDAGREVVIPGTGALERIYYTSPIGQIYCFTLAPELAAGTTMKFTDEELAYLPEGTADLPFLGTMAGGQQLNPEAIMAEDVQLIFSITSFPPKDGDASTADELQNMTGIPVVVLDGSFDNTANCYDKLGFILGKEDEAKVLSDYCLKALADVDAAVATIPEDERISVYYAEGPEGLNTEPESSPHAAVIKRSGAFNVAVDVEAQKGKGMSPVSLEQILAWNPDVIISWDASRHEGGADQIIREDPNWATIKAVKDNRVYSMPQTPFSWIDRPPAVNRVIGLQWLTNLLYPEYYDIDIVETTKEFYELFYHTTLTDEDVEIILQESFPQ